MFLSQSIIIAHPQAARHFTGRDYALLLSFVSNIIVPKQTTFFASPFQLGANGLALSPNGKMVAMVAYWDQGNTYMIWKYRLGEALPAIVEGTDGASYPLWSPDGQSIASLFHAPPRPLGASQITCIDLQPMSVRFKFSPGQKCGFRRRVERPLRSPSWTGRV